MVSTETGKTLEIGPGSSPTISPDGRYLAWATGAYGRMVSVRDLRTSDTRTFNLTRQVGRDATLGDEDNLAWLNDGRLVGVTLETTPPVGQSTTTRRRSGTRSGAPASCATYQGDDLCLIIVNPEALMPGRDAQLEIAAIPHFVSAVSNAASSHGLVVADDNSIYHLNLSEAVPHVTAKAPVPGDGYVEALTPGGRAVLYVTYNGSHGPDELWSAQVGATALADRHVVIADTQVDVAAW